MTNLELMQYIFEHIYLFYHSYDSFPCEKKIALRFTSHKTGKKIAMNYDFTLSLLRH
jgi:hypothetical protein